MSNRNDIIVIEEEDVEDEDLDIIEDLEEQDSDKDLNTKTDIDSKMTIEDILESEQNKSKDDFVLYIPTFTTEEYTDYVNKKSNKEDKKYNEFKDSYSDVISNQFDFLSESLSEANDLSLKYEKDGISIEDIDISSKNYDGKLISGKKAKLLLLIAAKKGKNIFLPNSGFNIVSSNPQLNDLDILYEAIYDNLLNYGYYLGAFAYLFGDIYIKKIFLSLIDKLIVHSNLENYNKNDNFLKMLSFHDYDILLHNMCVSMYKDGYEFIYSCPNCDYYEKNLIDLNELKYIDFSKIPEKNLKFLANRKVKKSIEDVKKYQRTLGFDDTVKIEQYELLLKVPNMYDFLMYGESFNEELFDVLKDPNKDNFRQYMLFNEFSIYLPWVNMIHVLNDDGSVNFKVRDMDSKKYILNELQLENKKVVIEEIKKYIEKTKLGHICFRANPCPNCGYLPKTNINGFIPIDIQHYFFTLSVMRLISHY
jgi:hypothetical protein